MFDGLLALFLRSIAVEAITMTATTAAIANVAIAVTANSGLRLVCEGEVVWLGVAVGL